MAMIAHKCPHIKVTKVDISQPRIDAWNSDDVPIYEPGLNELVKACRSENLFFTTDVTGAIVESEMIFVCQHSYQEKWPWQGQGGRSHLLRVCCAYNCRNPRLYSTVATSLTTSI